MAKLDELKGAGHSYAPGFGDDDGTGALIDYFNSYLAPSDQQLAVGAVIVAVLLVGRALIKYLGHHHRGF